MAVKVGHRNDKPKPRKWDDWVYFMRHIVEWGWPSAFLRLDGESLVVVDQHFLERLLSLPGSYKCDFSTPDDLNVDALGSYKRILVFTQRGEQDLVAQIKGKYPKTVVASGMHDFSLVNRERLARLTVIRSKPKPAKRGPIVFLATPNAGAEFFAENLAKNNALAPWEYIGRPFVLMSKLYDGLDFETLVQNAETRYKTDDGIAYIFQTDVLSALFQTTEFSQDQFIDWLKREQATVVTFQQKDTIAQAFACGLLKSTYTRSIWTLRRAPQFDFKYDDADTHNIMDALFHLNVGNQMIADIAAALPSVHTVWLDDGLLDVAATLKAIADHVGVSLPQELELLDYKNNYWLSEKVSEAQFQFQSDLIDRLGLSTQLS